MSGDGCPAVQVRAEAKEALARRAAPGAAPGVAEVAVGAPHGTGVQAGLDEATGAAEHSTPSEGARHACDTRTTRVKAVVLCCAGFKLQLYKALQSCATIAVTDAVFVFVSSQGVSCLRMSSYVFVCLQTGFRWN